MSILYVDTNPRVRTYQCNAFIESILSDRSDYDAWISNNYIQLALYKKDDEDTLDYFGGSIFGCIPLLEYKSYEDCSYLKNQENEVHEKFQEWIDSGNYIYTFLNEYYVPERFAYLKFSFNHDVLIYGYDAKKQVYLLIGYNDRGNYATSEISYKNLTNAFLNEVDCLILVKKKEMEYSFNYNKFKTMITEYRNGVDSRNNLDVYLDMKSYNHPYYDVKLGNYVCFGLTIYQGIEELLENAYNKSLDYRLFYLIYEHKVNMELRIKYLIKTGYIKDINFQSDYNTLSNKANQLFSMVLKYNINYDSFLLERLKKIIGELHKEEADILDKLLEVM